MQTIPESVVLRRIANCLETSQFHTGEGNRALANWWHDRADMYADRLTKYRELVETASRQHIISNQWPESGLWQSVLVLG
jgi:hypothetical protein